VVEIIKVEASIGNYTPVIFIEDVQPNIFFKKTLKLFF
jgi:hypothetical protein